MEEGQEKIAPITASEYRDVGLCVKGQRKFAKERGLDFREYVLNGLPIEKARILNPAATALVLKMRAARERPR